MKRKIAIGSANKIGIGITPPGHGFLPRERLHSTTFFLQISKLTPEEIDCICYSNGPGMEAPVASLSHYIVRVVSQLWKKPIVAVWAHIEMGRVVTGAGDPVVLYVSGGTTAEKKHKSNECTPATPFRRRCFLCCKLL